MKEELKKVLSVEDVSTLTKPDKIDEVQQIRKELVDKFTLSGLYKDNQKLWENVACYIDCTYKKDEIENIFIMGDGASYIKEGREKLDLTDEQFRMILQAEKDMGLGRLEEYARQHCLYLQNDNTDNFVKKYKNLLYKIERKEVMKNEKEINLFNNKST